MDGGQGKSHSDDDVGEIAEEHVMCMAIHRAKRLTHALVVVASHSRMWPRASNRNRK